MALQDVRAEQEMLHMKEQQRSRFRARLVAASEAIKQKAQKKFGHRKQFNAV